jgi:hypothetical protein
MRIDNSLNLLIGKDENHLDRIFFHIPNDPVGQSPDLFTGDVEEFFQTWWAKDDEIYIRQDQPLPLNILAIILRSETEER